MVPAAAMADGFDIAIPEDKPEPPKDIAIPKPDPKPDFPLADAPKPQAPKPNANPQPNPQGPQGVDPQTADENKKKAKKVVSAKVSPDSIDRSENLFAAGPAEVELVADDSDGAMDLIWLLVGGGVVTASGIAFAARKRVNA